MKEHYTLVVTGTDSQIKALNEAAEQAGCKIAYQAWCHAVYQRNDWKIRSEKTEAALAAANALIETLHGPIRTSEAIDWALTADAAGVEQVYPKPSLPPGWKITRVPDVEFQPRDQIYISKIGVDGKAERGGTACRLDDSSLFWHFFNDWLLTQEGTD